MKGNQQHDSATWGYVLIVIAIVALAFVLALPRTSVSMAQEPTRSAPAPTRPVPAPTRDTPPPPTASPEPTGTPATESPATATAVPSILPDSGGAGWDGFMLLIAGLAFIAIGVGVSTIHRRRPSVK